MTDLRTAAQQALEALEGWDNYGKWVWPESALEQAKRNTTEAVTALRAALAKQTEPNAEYERGFIDGMQKQAQSSVDRAVNRMAEPERHFCERCGKRLSQDGVHTCTPPQQTEPVDTDCHTQGICQRSGYDIPKP